MIVSKLAEILQRRRLSQRQLSRMTGLNRITISRLVGNRNAQFDARVLDAICSTLRIALDDLLRFEANSHNTK